MSTKQVNYQTQENVTKSPKISCTVRKLPVSTSTKKSRCKEFIDALSDLNISMNYDRLFNIKSQHRDAVTAQINNNEIVFL